MAESVAPGGFYVFDSQRHEIKKSNFNARSAEGQGY